MDDRLKRLQVCFPSRFSTLLSPADQAGLERIGQARVPREAADREDMLAAGTTTDGAREDPGASLAHSIGAHRHSARIRDLAKRIDQAMEELHFHILRSKRAQVDTGPYLQFPSDLHGVSSLSIDVFDPDLRPALPDPFAPQSQLVSPP